MDVMSHTTLFINSTVKADQGLYKCELRLVTGEKKRMLIRLNVMNRTMPVTRDAKTTFPPVAPTAPPKLGNETSSCEYM